MTTTINKKDSSKKVSQNSKMKDKLAIKVREDLTEKQQDLLNILTNKKTKIVFLIGPAGTSKTYCAILAGLMLLNEKKVSDIIYLRSAVESSENRLGFLPGETDDKMLPYLQPLLDKLTELLQKSDIDKLYKENRIVGMPINYLRGINWNSKYIIGDEFQNCSRKELITIMTRLGEFSKLIMCADPDQTDIGNKSGYLSIANLFDDVESQEQGIFVFRFNEEDVVRSGLCKYLLEKFKNFLLRTN